MDISSLITSATQAGLRPVEIQQPPLTQPGTSSPVGDFREMLTRQIMSQSESIQVQAHSSLHPTYQSAISQSQSNGVVADMIQGVQQSQGRAAMLTREVLTGKSENLHGAMIALEEASVSFQMLVEMRNKMLESIQELMRMQV